MGGAKTKLGVKASPLNGTVGRPEEGSVGIPMCDINGIPLGGETGSPLWGMLRFPLKVTPTLEILGSPKGIAWEPLKTPIPGWEGDIT